MIIIICFVFQRYNIFCILSCSCFIVQDENGNLTYSICFIDEFYSGTSKPTKYNVTRMLWIVYRKTTSNFMYVILKCPDASICAHKVLYRSVLTICWKQSEIKAVLFQISTFIIKMCLYFFYSFTFKILFPAFFSKHHPGLVWFCQLIFSILKSLTSQNRKKTSAHL